MTEDGESEESGGLDVPESPPDPETTDHVLAPEELAYPTFGFDTGSISTDAGFDLRRELDGKTAEKWLRSLAGAIGSHDLAVEGTDLRATFGIRPAGVRMAFDPDDGRRGTLEVTLTLDAAVMRYEDADARPIGARGDRGFVPLEMLTGDRDPGSFRCYNWVEDPTAGIGDEEPRDGTGASADEESASGNEEESASDDE